MRSLLIILSALLLAACSHGNDLRKTADEAPAFPSQRISEAEQKDFNALFLRATRATFSGDYDASIVLLREALRINPTAPEACFRLGQLLYLTATYSDSLQRQEGLIFLRRAASLAPRNVDVIEQVAPILESEKHNEEALLLRRRAMSMAPSPQRIQQVMLLESRLEKWDDALTTLDRLEAAEGKSTEKTQYRAWILNKKGDQAAVYALIEKLCAEEPDNLNHRVFLGSAYDANGYHDMALRIFRDVLTLEPTNADALAALYDFYCDQGADSAVNAMARDIVLNSKVDTELRVKVLQDFSKSRNKETNPTDTAEIERLFNDVLQLPEKELGFAYSYFIYLVTFDHNDPTELARAYRAILEADPEQSWARDGLIEIMINEKNFEQAQMLANEARLYNPHEIRYFYLEAVALDNLGQTEEGVALLKKGLNYIDEEENADFAADYLGAMGSTLWDIGQRTEALAFFEQAIARDTTDLTLLNNYAYFSSLAGKNVARAAELSRRTIEEDPENAVFLDTYAWILFTQRRYKLARTYIDRALEIFEASDDEASSTYYEHAGDIYYRCNLRAEAVRLWIKALGLETDEAKRKVLQRKIRNKRL